MIGADETGLKKTASRTRARCFLQYYLFGMNTGNQEKHLEVSICSGSGNQVLGC